MGLDWQVIVVSSSKSVELIHMWAIHRDWDGHWTNLHTYITKFHNLKSQFIDTLGSWFWTIHARCSSVESSSDVFTNDNKAMKVSKLFICAPSHPPPQKTSLKVATHLATVPVSGKIMLQCLLWSFLGHCLFVLNWGLSIASRRKTGDEYPPLAKSATSERTSGFRVGSFTSFFFSKELLVPRVDWLVTEQLSAQSRLDPRGELCCFWCPNKLEPLLLAHLTH